MTARRIARLLSVVAGVLSTVAMTAPAYAALDDGEQPGKPISIIDIVLIYVVVPVGVVAIIAILSTLPGLLRRPRYRPGKPWPFDPLWFGGPQSPDTAVASARPGSTGKGGASGDW